MIRRAAIGSATAASIAAAATGILAVRTGVDLLPVLGIVAAAIVIVIAAVLAVRRYAALILLLLVVRPELDAVGHSTASAVGLVFLGGSAWWLLSRWRHDRLLRPTPAAWGLIAFVGAASLSTLGSHLPLLSAGATTRLAAGVLMFVVIEQLVRSGTLSTRSIHLALAASAVLVCAHVAVQVLAGSAPVDESTGLSRVTGPFVHASVLGKYAAVVTVLMLARAVWTQTADRLLWALGAIATSAVVLLTYTRAAWLALALGVLVLAYRRDHRWLPVIAVAGLIGFAATPSLNQRLVDVWDPPEPPPGAPASSLAWRVDYWHDLLPLGRVNPLNGIGLDVVPTVRSEGLLPHNVWVQTWIELGLLGVLVLLGVVVTTVLTLRRASRALQHTSGERRAALEAALAVAVGLFVVTLSENLLDETTTLWCAAAVMASGWSASRLPEPRDEDAAPWWLNRSGWRERRPRRGRDAASPR
ncbi:O-antigen ligase family protein [Janibacter sp. GS2]|uniref:O-antigen ligase family protein n=1 Tax=Janibacter sp. GS2 TaxID=3442646 RepID=UPI003EB77870